MLISGGLMNRMGSMQVPIPEPTKIRFPFSSIRPIAYRWPYFDGTMGRPRKGTYTCPPCVWPGMVSPTRDGASEKMSG